jgi:hypothetical protein
LDLSGSIFLGGGSILRYRFRGFGSILDLGGSISGDGGSILRNRFRGLGSILDLSGSIRRNRLGGLGSIAMPFFPGGSLLESRDGEGESLCDLRERLVR